MSGLVIDTGSHIAAALRPETITTQDILGAACLAMLVLSVVVSVFVVRGVRGEYYESLSGAPEPDMTIRGR